MRGYCSALSVPSMCQFIIILSSLIKSGTLLAECVDLVLAGIDWGSFGKTSGVSAWEVSWANSTFCDSQSPACPLSSTTPGY